jgi:hypothetical protein
VIYVNKFACANLRKPKTAILTKPGTIALGMQSGYNSPLKQVMARLSSP